FLRFRTAERCCMEVLKHCSTVHFQLSFGLYFSPLSARTAKTNRLDVVNLTGHRSKSDTAILVSLTAIRHRTGRTSSILGLEKLTATLLSPFPAEFALSEQCQGQGILVLNGLTAIPSDGSPVRQCNPEGRGLAIRTQMGRLPLPRI